MAERARALAAPVTAEANFHGKVIPQSRICDLGWIYRHPDTAFLFDAIAAEVETANKAFGFHLLPFTGGFQWTVYRPGGHYEWHTDWGTVAPYNQRKLSVSLCLTPLADYEGGEFEYHLAGEPTTVRMDLGALIIFPSFTPHRVRPVTSGTRLSLVAWFCGAPLV